MSLKFEEMLDKFNISYTDRMIEQFNLYYDILIQWNKFMNLTGITEYHDVTVKHFIDSLSIVKIIDMANVTSLIDVGTGAGFPGVPIKIIFPHIKICLLDSLNKRVKFLNEIISKLDLDNISALHGRAEEIAKRGEYREKYDLCVSRAVANLSSLSEYCLPFVKKGGQFISYKSSDIDKELLSSKHAISVLGGKIEDIIKFKLPNTDIDRSLILINKVNETNRKYPRKAGMPTKEPL